MAGACNVQACARYESAWQLRESSHSALYNWGVALSDMSRALKGTDRAAALSYLLAAADKYALSLKWNPNNPQVRTLSVICLTLCGESMRCVSASSLMHNCISKSCCRESPGSSARLSLPMTRNRLSIWNLLSEVGLSLQAV